MSKIGRNDPCPCGSGKKYKKCCLAKDQAAKASSESHHEQCVDIVNSLQGRTVEFVRKAGYDGELKAAQLYYLTYLDPSAGDMEPDDRDIMAFMEWFVSDYRIPEEDKTVIELFLGSNPKLPVEEMQVLQDWQDRVISAYQVVGLRKGEGFTLKNLLLDEPERLVTDHSLSGSVYAGDIFIARLFRVQDEWHCSATTSVGESRLKKAFLANVDYALEEFRQDNPGADIKQFLKAHGFILPELLAQANQAIFSHPKVVTTSGEELVFHQAHYDLLDSKHAQKRLRTAEDFELEDVDPGGNQGKQTECVWLDQGPSAALMEELEEGFPSAKHEMFSPGQGQAGSSRLLGRVILKARRLTLEVTGDKRFGVGKKRLEELLHGLIKHRLDAVKPIQMPGPGSRMATPDPNLGPADVSQFEPLQPNETIRDALQNREFESLEEANAFLQQAMGSYNDRPQPEMGGLSPNQVRRLLECDWEDEYGPVRLNCDLTLAELQGVLILHNARLIMTQAHDQGGIKATQAGYLNTQFVRQVFDQMLWPEDLCPDWLIEENQRLKEADVHEIMLLRHLLEFAGLLKLEYGRFRLTKLGRELLPEEKAGELYAKLFATHFQLLNLDVLDPTGAEYPSIQSTLAFTFYALQSFADGIWHRLTDLIPMILLPAIKAKITGQEDHAQWQEDDYWELIDILDWRLISPLENWFGLWEEMDDSQADKDIDISLVRPTPLFGRFVNFHL